MLLQGTVKSVRIVDCFGFIEPKGTGADVFFDSQVLEGLHFDEQLVARRVLYESFSDKRGPRATVVRPAK